MPLTAAPSSTEDLLFRKLTTMVSDPWRPVTTHLLRAAATRLVLTRSPADVQDLLRSTPAELRQAIQRIVKLGKPMPEEHWDKLIRLQLRSSG